jgi:hypothetical protein
MDMPKRSRAANSLYYFSFYMLIVGLILMIYPKPLGLLVGLQMPMDPTWRLVGMFMVIVGLIDFQAGRTGQMVPIYILSVYIRICVAVALIIMVAAELFPFIILLFGFIDFSCAMWTLFAVKKDLKEK